MRTYILPFADPKSQIRLMFMDEASFGRISERSYCWCPDGIRPIVPCHRVREYMYAFGAIDPMNGDSSFIVAPKCNTDWTNAFLQVVSKEYANDYLLICLDRTSWHNSKALIIPDNIYLFYLPPYTPEMNPIEQIWKEIRKNGFKNTLFSTLNKVMDKLCNSIVSLSNDVVKSVCARDWIVSLF